MVEKNVVWSYIKDDKVFLFVTATEIESEALHEKMIPIIDNSISVCYIGNYTYYIGKFGNYPIIHVECGSMGAVGKDAAIMTVSDAIQEWEPDGVIMVGIAFGLKPEEQNMGDVLISRCLRNYEFKKVTERGYVQRSSVPEAGNVLYNRFSQCDWKYPAKGKKAKKHKGELISGEKVINNKRRRDEIKKFFPNAIGGDMESFGVYSAAANKNITEWIIVKGICDWAFDKDKDKDKLQKKAAKASVNLSYTVFSETSLIDIPFNEKRKKRILDDGGVVDVATVKYALNTLIGSLKSLSDELVSERKIIDTFDSPPIEIKSNADLVESELSVCYLETMHYKKVIESLNTPGNKIPINSIEFLFDETINHKEYVIKIAKCVAALFSNESQYSEREKISICNLLQEHFEKYLELIYAEISRVLVSLSDSEKKHLADGLIYIPIIREVFDPKYCFGDINNINIRLNAKKQMFREVSDMLESYKIL